jgi:hypothetical protein
MHQKVGFLDWAVSNLGKVVALSFLLQDASVISYFSGRNIGIETEFMKRMASLPGGLIFWGFDG